jgi:spermidine synthase
VQAQTQQLPISKSIVSKHFTIVTGLFFLSGAAGLILQVVWMYRLGLVFGNAAYATAATLAAFFLGLAIGGWVWGNASAKLKRPLRLYGLMEIGIAITALLFIPGLDFYENYYATLVSFLDGQSGMLTFLKFMFSITLLLFPTILMGGTFPVLAQYVGKKRRQLEMRGTLLYALNTIGASLGAFLAGFILLSRYGVNSTYAFAIALAAAVGVAAIILDTLTAMSSELKQADKTRSTATKMGNSGASINSALRLNYSLMITLAFTSGLLALSAETAWIKMFAQVLQNSVYSFSAILVVFLIALGCGGFLSHLLVRFNFRPLPTLLVLLSSGAILVALSPVIFNRLTDGLGYVAGDASWAGYLGAVFKMGFLVVFPPTLILGTVFPYLLKASPKTSKESGQFVGLLVLCNSIGSTIGPILIGFFILDAIGLWGSIKIIAVIYGALGLLIAFSIPAAKSLRWMALPVAGIIIAAVMTNPPLVHLEKGERLLNTWQSTDGVVSVVQSNENIQMRLDNFYVLGDSRSTLVEQMQGHIPLLLHPDPERVLFLGMGTGITAGASLNHNVERVVAVELVSNVITAAESYFTPWLNGLFSDSRVEIVADDARNYLLGTREKFDVIVGDLFTPWHAGTGSLYSLEHFKMAKEQLKPGGIFAQWLPLYQLTPEGFETIAATFNTVFPEVTLWRADFSGSRASIALIGQQKGSQLDQQALERNIAHVVGSKDSSPTEHMAGLFYLGNLNAIEQQLSETELNTDDRRTIEFEAPILSQRANAGDGTYMAGMELEKLLMSLSKNLPPEEDPYLSNLPQSEIRYATVGLLYYRYLNFKAAGQTNKADSLKTKINQLAPGFLNDSTQTPTGS